MSEKAIVVFPEIAEDTLNREFEDGWTLKAMEEFQGKDRILVILEKKA